MILIKNYITQIKLSIENYLLISILSKHLHSSYMVKSIYTFILILLALCCYIILSTGIIYYLEGTQYFNILYNTVIIFTVLDLFFIIFNLIIRIYYLFFKGVPFYFKEETNLNKLSNFDKIMLHYFIKNTLLILLSIYTIYKISNLLLLLDHTLFEYTHFYRNFISIILGLIYIVEISEYIYKLPNNTNVTELSKVLAFAGLILNLIYMLSVIFLFNTTTIYCSDGEGEKFTNNQVNDNIQRNRPATPTFSLNPETGEEAPQSNVQKNKNIQENVEGSQVRSCQVNKNVQVNSNTPNISTEINLSSIKKIKYPIIEIPHIHKLTEKHFIRR